MCVAARAINIKPLCSTAGVRIWPVYIHGAKRTEGLMTDYFSGQREPWVPIQSADKNAGQTKTKLCNRILPITSPISPRTVKCTVSSAAGSQPGDQTPPDTAPSHSARLQGEKPHSPSSSPLSLTWASFGGGLVKLWLFPTCLCMCLSILSAPPAEPARWMQFLWLLQLPGPGRAVGCWSWQDRRLPLDQPET